VRRAIAVPVALFALWGPSSGMWEPPSGGPLIAALWGPPSGGPLLAALWGPPSGGPLLAAQPTALRGRVIAADPGLPDVPLRRARLTVIAGGQAAAPVFADEAGAFALTVPSSPYTLRVTKAGYAPVDLLRPPAGPPLTVTLPRAAAVRGRVVDAAGDPSVGVAVRLRRLSPPPAESGAIQAVGETDDRGEFRFGSLPAGRYAIDATHAGDPTAVLEDMPHEMAAMMREAMAQRARESPPTTETVIVDATPGDDAAVTLVQNFPALSYPYAAVGGVVTGVLLDEFGEPAENVSVRLWLSRFVDGRVVMAPAGRSRGVDDGGRYRMYHVPAGRYMVVVTPAPEPEPGGTRPEPFLSVYYPGRLEVGAAADIDVARAQETSGVDMTVLRSRGARVYGTALSAAGGRLNGSVLLVPSDSSGPQRAAPFALGSGISTAPLAASPAADGTFEIRNVPPGLYALQAAATNTSGNRATESITVNGVQRTVLIDLMHVEGITEFAMQRLAVGEADIGPVTMTTIATSVVSGRVTVDGPGRLISPAEFELIAANIDPDEIPAVSGAFRRGAEIESDGTFRLTGLTGRSLIVLARAPSGWWLKSAEIGGLNAAEEPVAFGSSADSRDDVTLVLSPNGATISGRVTDAENASGFSVVVFPVAPGLRVPGSRYLRTTALDTDGRFSLNSFPPGDYYAIAVEEADGETLGQWENPAALNTLAPLAQRVTLRESELRTLDLRLQRVPR